MREEDGEKGKWGGERRRGRSWWGRLSTRVRTAPEEEVCLSHYRGNGAWNTSLPTVLPLVYNTSSTCQQYHIFLFSLCLQ